ncbi:hypothetical protein V6N12_011055 [Hibiscus sabdariffa]|uniref:Uncharacterized protein n=1 Tax=Hibiscus sabdariffa TaxID=183260 RepID=A0ABR2ELW9_9ROSI
MCISFIKVTGTFDFSHFASVFCSSCQSSRFEVEGRKDRLLLCKHGPRLNISLATTTNWLAFLGKATGR